MQFVRNLLNEQRRRLVGSLMQYLEVNVYPGLSEPQRKDLRTKVLASVGAYHDVCVDMLKASVDDNSVANEEALQLLARVNSQMQALRSDLRRSNDGD